MYNKVSIPRPSGAPGSPMAFDPTIIVIAAEDIASEPARSLGDTVLDGDITLATGAKAIGIYATQSTVEHTEEYSGDPDARGCKQGLSFAHPGNSAEIKGFVEKHLNTPVVILAKTCDGNTGKYQVFGSKCNPLYLNVETAINNEATRRTLKFAQERAGQFLPGDYSGTIPTLADVPEEETETT